MLFVLLVVGWLLLVVCCAMRFVARCLEMAFVVGVVDGVVCCSLVYDVCLLTVVCC